MTDDALPSDPRYVAARRVLLDALDALRPHRGSLVVVGAQAVYLRTGTGNVGIAPYTTDGDLALDPSRLGDDPRLELAMTGAGFRLHEPQPDRPEPGTWVARVEVGGHEVIVPVDLIVPDAVAAPGGRRGARLGPHGNRAARRTTGLEAALVDHSPITLTGLEPDDTRAIEVEVAEPAALLVAKAHKIHDRLESRRVDRADDKDAADVYRLMQTSPPEVIAVRLGQLRGDSVAGPATDAAIGYMSELFGRRGAPGVAMASRALRLAVPEAEVIAFTTAYLRRLQRELDERR